ncbi:MAG: hypothetical protein Q9218_007966 [Villophora microphyllina]
MFQERDEQAKKDAESRNGEQGLRPNTPLLPIKSIVKSKMNNLFTTNLGDDSLVADIAKTIIGLKTITWDVENLEERTFLDMQKEHMQKEYRHILSQGALIQRQLYDVLKRKEEEYLQNRRRVLDEFASRMREEEEGEEVEREDTEDEYAEGEDVKSGHVDGKDNEGIAAEDEAAESQSAKGKDSEWKDTEEKEDGEREESFR